MPSTTTPRGGTILSSNSAAPPYRTICWSPSCSDTKKGPSPMPVPSVRDASSRPTAVLCSWTRSARSAGSFRSSHTLKANDRIIAATNRDLESGVKVGGVPEGTVLSAQCHAHLHVRPAGAPRGNAGAGTLSGCQDRKAQDRRFKITDCTLRILVRHDWPGVREELAKESDYQRNFHW